VPCIYVYSNLFPLPWNYGQHISGGDTLSRTFLAYIYIYIYIYRKTLARATKQHHYFCISLIKLIQNNSQWGFYRNVIWRRWDCGKNPILINVHLTGIQLHCPTELTLFKKCGGNKTIHRPGPPARTRNFLTEHLVQVFEKYTRTRCSLRKFRGDFFPPACWIWNMPKLKTGKTLAFQD